MNKYDFLTAVGIIVGVGLVLMGIIVQDGELGAFMDPAGMMITLGGTFGATLVSFRQGEIKTVVQVTKNVFFQKEQSIIDLHDRFTDLAQKARREGLLVLEDELDEIEDPFFRNGLQMVIDGFEPDNIRSILNAELTSMEARHEQGQKLFSTMGTFSPAFGMIGTLIGLIMMLAELDDPDAIGPGMSVALLTTFYGVFLANLVFIPISNKLALHSEEESRMKEIIIEALLALQSGINPRLLKEQIKSYFSPQEKKLLEEAQKRAEEEEEDDLVDV